MAITLNLWLPIVFHDMAHMIYSYTTSVDTIVFIQHIRDCVYVYTDLPYHSYLHCGLGYDSESYCELQLHGDHRWM